MGRPAQKQNLSKAPSKMARARVVTAGPQPAGPALNGQRVLGNRAVRRMLESDDSITEVAAQGAAGSGGPLPFLDRIKRSFGRHDVSDVRAYQGSNTTAAAAAIGAKAYTIGDRIGFGRPPDLRTVAHEAAHVVQQRAGIQLAGKVGKVGDVYERHADAVAERVVSGRSSEGLLNQIAPAGSRALSLQRQLVQRTPIDTNYGKFDTTKYDDVGTKGSEHGVDIVLTFDPDKTKVDAKKIGLTQSVIVKLGGSTANLFPIHAERTVPSGTGAGAMIDRYGGAAYGNPIYGTGINKATDKLGDTPMTSNAEWGWNYKDGKTEKHQTAILRDKPTLPGRGNNSSQKFESAALAVEGTQSGTYMGSVTWGWSVDGAGKFTKDALTLKSKGTPSAEFIAAAKQWNKTSVGGTVKTTADPTNVYDNSYSVAFTVAKDTEVQISKAAPIHNDVTYDEVTIKSGKEAGKTGRVKVNDMKESGGTAVIKLPT